VSHPAQRVSAVGFNRHAPAAPVPGLPAAQLGGHRVEVDREPRGHAFENRDERLAVRLTGSEKTQHPPAIVSKLLPHPAHRLANSRMISTGRLLAQMVVGRSSLVFVVGLGRWSFND
jgi:hypothetical protein